MKTRNTIFTAIVLALGFFAVRPAPNAFGVSPAPDGGYPGANTAEGQDALLSLTTGSYNTAVGIFALRSDTTGSFNTAIGAGTLLANVGDPSSGRGVENTATGFGALLSNTTGANNTANGALALFNNTTGVGNIGTGDEALFSNTSGRYNTATGGSALGANITGDGNTAIGSGALFNNTGSNNTALGSEAGSNLTSGDNNIYLGSLGVATESNTIRIGTSGTQDRAFIRGIRGVTTGNNDAIQVLIDSAGQLGTMSSSRRFKKEIKPMDCASEAILALKPVTFHYKSDTKDTPQFGLIAEEVAEVNPELVVRDENSEIYTVRYDAVNAMLLNEFLKEHKIVQELQARVQNQEATIAHQQKSFQSEFAAQEKRLETVTAGLEKLSAQLELSKSRSQTVLNNR